MTEPRKRIIPLLVILALVAQQTQCDSYKILEILERPVLENCKRVLDDLEQTICTCTESSCDELQFDWPITPGSAVLVETTRSGLRFRAKNLSEIEPLTSESSIGLSTVRVDLNLTHQTIMGFGGAFTDAAGININGLSEQMRHKLLSSYFGPLGLQYNFGRVPIAGSDFSTRAYSYDDTTTHADYNLSEWRLAPEDRVYKIPLIKAAMKLAAKSDVELKLFASPWSPPEWMKTNRNFKRGHLINSEQIYRAYANYLIKFYRAYKKHGITFWGATVQNEPISSYLPFYFFNSLQMNADETKKFIVNHLGPALVAEGYTKQNFKLMIGDDSLLLVNQQVSVLDDAQVRKYVSGLAFHWYTSNVIAPYSSLSSLVDTLKDKIEFVIMSEACNGAYTPWKHVDLGSWQRGEAYAVDIIEDMRRQTGAWIDWNLALDEQGGPNWSHNYVDSPIIVNKASNSFQKQPMYYVLAHFSRFFRPGSIRVASELENGSYFEKIMTLSALNNKTGHLVVNILNKATSARHLSLRVEPDGVLTKKAYELGPFQVDGKSISTVVLKL